MNRLRPFRDFRRSARLLVACLAVFTTAAGVNVTTYHYDNGRTGLNAQETVLTPANVNVASFGKLFSQPVDGYIYAQPLILCDVSVPALGVHNVVFVATEHDSVYAFDADFGDGPNAQPLWQTSFLDPANGVTTVPSIDVGNGSLTPEIGITSTPVIDPDTGTIFVEVKTKENGLYVHRIHALDVGTGLERPGSPVVVQGSVAGNGYDSVGPTVTFNPKSHMSRPALTLYQPPGAPHKIVVAAFASHDDLPYFHGWLMAYDAVTLQPAGILNTTPNGGLGGFWMGGNGMAADAGGSLYGMTGNGSFDATQKNYGDSVVRVAYATNQLRVADNFTPFNQAALSSADLDLGSGGCLVLPDEAGSAAHPHLLVGGGKESRIYLVDRDHLGGYHAGDDSQIVQAIPPGVVGPIYTSPAYFNHRIYYKTSLDALKAFSITNASINTNPVSRAGVLWNQVTPPVISANGVSNGIVWALQIDGVGRAPDVLRAFDAMDLTHELYNSAQAGDRDVGGYGVKTQGAIEANGKVYVGTTSQLDVYGQGTWAAEPVISPAGGSFTGTVNVTITDASPGAVIHYTLDGSTPTAASPQYSGAIAVSNSTPVKAFALAPGMNPSPVAFAEFVSQNFIGTGTGLLGQYWAGQNNFSGAPGYTSVDARGGLFLVWHGSPGGAVPATPFSSRWTGTVQPQFNEVYTFYTVADSGTRLWVNGQLLIDRWLDQGVYEFSGSIALTAGQKASIRIDHYHNDNVGGSSQMVLYWSSPSTPKQVIPSTQLYVPVAPPLASFTATPSDSVIGGPASLTLDATVSSAQSTLARVDFLVGTNVAASLSAPPYSVTLTNLPPGSPAVAVQAYDTDANTTLSTHWTPHIAPPASPAPYGLDARPLLPAYLGFSTNAADALPPVLSLTGAMADTPSFTLVDGMIPYTPAAPFWSDGAIKQRWLGIPYSGGPMTPGNQITYAQDANLDFPKGSVFVKHFLYKTNELDYSPPRRLETRLLVYGGQGVVYGATYRWRADGTEADLVTSSQTENILITTASGIRTQTWYYPSPGDCLVCHTPSAGGLLGVSKTRQLNAPATYAASGVTDNQLRTLNHLGMLYPALNELSIAAIPRYAPASDLSSSLELRARSFLDVNCAYCHQPGGPGRASFDLRITTPLASSGLVNGTVAATFGIAGAKAVVPGDTGRSTVYYRVAATDPIGKMPPLARNSADQADLAVLGQWIDALYGTAPTLMVQPLGGGSVLSWPATSNLFYLHMSGAPDFSQWTNGPQGVLSGGVYSVTIPNGAPQQFFRLSSQNPAP